MATSTFSLGLSARAPILLNQFVKQPTYDDVIVVVLLLLGGLFYISHGRLWDKPDPYYYKWFERPQSSDLGLINTSANTRNIAEKLKESNKDVVVFWGSQSGTAEGFAHRLARDLMHRLRLETLAADLSDFDPHTVANIQQSQIAIFLLSTYGEGDPSDNATAFVNWLRSNPEVTLHNLRFAAFGCGNSNYKYYNAVIDQVTHSLESMGANKLLETGKADDAKGTTEEDFVDWKDTLVTAFSSQLGFSSEPQLEYIPSVRVVEDDSTDVSGIHLGEPSLSSMGKINTSSGPISSIVQLPITGVRDLVKIPTNAPSCLHMEFDLSRQPMIKYKTGDHMAIFPVNPDAEVSMLLRLLKLEARENVPIMITPIDPDDSSLRIPSPTTPRALFQHYLEVCGPVSREVVRDLAQWASTERARSFLLGIVADKATYADFVARHHLTLGRLLQHTLSVDCNADWSGLPLSFIVDNLRPMTPRYYSISSSSVTSPRRVSVTVAVESSPLPLDTQTTIPGLARSYLSSFLTFSPQPALGIPKSSPSPSIYAFIRRSAFKLPASQRTPLILIAAGTGIAPFRAFVQERARLAAATRSSSHSPAEKRNSSAGPILLFFGCRHPERNLLYQDEFFDLENDVLKGKLTIIHAFSRLEGQKKMYVQDRVEEKMEEVSRLLLEEDASLYVCGSAAMARDVSSTICQGVKLRKGFEGEDEVKKWREERKRAKKWQEDVWG
ncbi:uncharacterized protein Z518_05657 [Rhinocladiella mackenziei CBS 650.93]|uniref:NADPH--hemoprotein reductase n=1 Tax=Rhinocladiella mackenziei CBS 650.93 TaxID=1442369 RepID=A0A0D2INT1_9EURO|nr:uncharacterized protein Z518_05657 [Rhinocladiella mackenziei CBS 650.93]KIX04786.1 hypothetical protein Z518_05657 [Rhinocladiella mackenziei CBS 650.93]